MIGIIADRKDSAVIEEFFQLFKTPWEYHQDDQLYDVVLVSGDIDRKLNTKLMVIYGSEKKQIDSEYNIISINHLNNRMLEWDDLELPVFEKISTFKTDKAPLLKDKETSEAVGITLNSTNTKILRFGYNLFREVFLLLSSGQPKEYAHIPTLEIHIAILRNSIIRSGIPLVEIPPVPAGYDFITCFTHDVDFVGIRRHKFDHTMFGFIYRALFKSVIGVIRGWISWTTMIRNWAAALSLPLVYLGLKDFMIQFDQYIEIEKDLKSTFYFIPFSGQSGQTTSGKAPKRRASRYGITDVADHVKKLISHGKEIGLHGIDAWLDTGKGMKELNQISDVVKKEKIGVRMHWLYYSENSPNLLEEAGFHYDSTFGYNDAIGFRAGTGQAYKPLNVKKMLELPLNIQDTALFYSGRMGLPEIKAMANCCSLLQCAANYGGVVTINWHHRSIAPERLWKKFYIELIKNIKQWNVWFGTASEIVDWFQKRRKIMFKNLQGKYKITKINVEKYGGDSQLPIVVRVYNPIFKKSYDSYFASGTGSCKDILWDGSKDIEIDMNMSNDNILVS